MVTLPSSSFFSGTNPTPTEYENAVGLVAQATAQANTAIAAADSASASALSSQGYSVSAGTSAGTATTQASSASTSATNAASSATSASTSATSASSSATAASSSASSASTSATNASNSATSAAGSATTAGTYATNAANSATAAANSASDAAATLANALTKSDNLASLSNASTARSNLGVAIGSNVQAWDADLDAIAAISSTSGLLKKTAANTWTLDTTSYHSGTLGLSQGGTGATDATSARSNLGLGTAATAASTSFLQVANNLSEVTPATARTNLGLGTAATLASSAVLQSANNLSDLANVVTARSSLGLSTLATTTPGTGVATALGVNTGTAGAFVVNGGALGTPASGNLANCTFPTLNQNTTGTAAGLSATLSVASGGTGLTSLTAGYIPFGAGTSAFGSDSGLFWENTNKFLGIGTSSPQKKFVVSQGGAQGIEFDPGLAVSTLNEFLSYNRSTSAYMTLQYRALDHRFNNSGTEAMRIGSTGNVAINTTTTSLAVLSLIGRASTTALLTEGAGGAKLYVDYGGAGSNYYDASTHYFRSTGGSNFVAIDSAGYVGIGTSSPSGKLHVVGGRSWFQANSEPYSLYVAYNSSTNGVFLGSPSAGAFQLSAPGGGALLNVDSSGNLGLGVTPSAWYGGKHFQFTYGAVGSSADGYPQLLNNGYEYAANAYKYITTGLGASMYIQQFGSHAWYNAASGTAGNAISFTQAMTLTSSGNLLVNTTASSTGKVAIDYTPSNQWQLDLAPTASGGSNFITLANGATYDLAVGSGIISVYSNDGYAAGVYLAAFGGTYAIVNAAGTSNTFNNASTVNIYYNLGTDRYRIQNNTGASRNLYIGTIRLRTQN